jgi:hypothetical protein
MPFSKILWIATAFKVCQNRGKLVHVKQQKNILLFKKHLTPYLPQLTCGLSRVINKKWALKAMKGDKAPSTK